MDIKKIELAWIVVSDFEKSKNFFVDTLGLKINEEHPSWLELSGSDGGMMLGVGGSCDTESKEEWAIKPGQNAVVTLTVDDIEQAKSYLVEKGVTIKGDIIEIPGHVKMLFFTDPDNNFFQLVQEIA